MNTPRTSRALARSLLAVSFRRLAIRGAAVLALAAPALTPAFAANPGCEPTSAASITSLPAPGSAEAWKMAKFPWLYLPKAPATDVTTHFPEPGSAEAVKFYKTPYLIVPQFPQDSCK